MDDEDLYDSDSDLEELIQPGKEVKIIDLYSIEQFLEHEKEINEITGIHKNPNIVHYIKFKPRS